MEIVRHESNGVLQGFSFYSETEIVVLQHTDVSYYGSPTTYRGWGSFGAADHNAQATAFVDMDTALQFIEDNNLVHHGQHPWHQQTNFRLFLTHHQNSQLLKKYPDFSAFAQHSEIEPVGVYVYLNYILPEHEQILTSEGITITPTTL
jgi:hypothetical protein